MSSWIKGLSVWVLLHAVVGIGHASSYVNCGGFVNGKSLRQGVITTPRYPLHYPNGSNCIWLLEVNERSKVNMTILGLQGEGDDGNCLDFLEIRAGSRASELLYRGCELLDPLIVLSPHRWMWVRFYSTEFVSNTGFTAKWKAVVNNNRTDTPAESPVKECPHTRFGCANKECVSWSYVCDGLMDCGCGDGCDEDVCGGASTLGPVSRIAVGTICGVIIFALTILFVAIMEKKIRLPCRPQQQHHGGQMYRRPSYIIKQEEAEMELQNLRRQVCLEEQQILKIRPPEEANLFCGNSVRPKTPSANSLSRFNLFNKTKQQPTIVLINTKEG